MNLYYYTLFWVCIAGLCLGSFYNVVILRSLSNESIVFPASKCPKCEHPLYWWHNIPVLSYIILRGKCYFCKEKISIQYPIIELITMLLFASAFIKYGFSYTTLFIMFWLSGLIIMTVTDLKEKIVDCNIAIALGISGTIFCTLQAGLNGFISSILGLLAGALIIEIIARIGYIFVGSRAMGEGDTYVAAALGAMFGIQGIISTLIYAFLASMIFIIPVFLYNSYKNNEKTICILSVLFILSILIFETVIQNYFSLAFVVLTGIGLAISILKSLKNTKKGNYLPYVPALCIGALFFVFI